MSANMNWQVVQRSSVTVPHSNPPLLMPAFIVLPAYLPTGIYLVALYEQAPHGARIAAHGVRSMTIKLRGPSGPLPSPATTRQINGISWLQANPMGRPNAVVPGGISNHFIEMFFEYTVPAGKIVEWEILYSQQVSA